MNRDDRAAGPRRTRVRLWLPLIALGLLLFLADRFVRIPTTASVPRGLYLLTDQDLRRGSWVVACLPEGVAALGRRRGYLGAGRCDGGSEVLKRVAALPGDVVDLTDAGIRVNGVELPNTSRHHLDSAGRPIPVIRPGRYVVAPGSCWLLSSHHPRSWDSRYYGAVPLTGVRSTARRLLPSPGLTD